MTQDSINSWMNLACLLWWDPQPKKRACDSAGNIDWRAFDRLYC